MQLIAENVWQLAGWPQDRFNVYLIGDVLAMTPASPTRQPSPILGMPNPSAVALSAVNGDSVFYATTEGVEHAFRFEIGNSVTQQTPGRGACPLIVGRRVRMPLIPVTMTSSPTQCPQSG